MAEKKVVYEENPVFGIARTIEKAGYEVERFREGRGKITADIRGLGIYHKKTTGFFRYPEFTKIGQLHLGPEFRLEVYGERYVTELQRLAGKLSRSHDIDVHVRLVRK